MDSRISEQLLLNHRVMHIVTDQQLLSTDIGGDADLIKLIFSRRRQPNKSRRTLRRRGKPSVSNISLFELLPEVSQVNPHLQSVLQGHESRAVIRNVAIVSPVDTTRHVDVTIAARNNEQGEFVGLSILLEDLTQHHLLNEKVENLETRLKLVQSQLDMAAHELGTPLTLISGYAEILHEICEELGFTSEQMQCMELINKNVDELHIIVSNLFDIVYAESGELQLTTTPVPLETMIRSACNELSERVIAKSQQLELGIQPDLSPIICDPARITQVLKCLVTNASNFSPMGALITVAANTIDEAGYIKVSVEDQGINVSEEEQEMIFEQFYRSKYSEQARGGNAGLGLHIAQILVELHGGEIWCSSNEGKQGSTFHFTLPTPDNAANTSWTGDLAHESLLYNGAQFTNGI